MVKYGKKINIKKKFKNLPSTQSSGMPLKSISGIARINNVNYNKHGQVDPFVAIPPAGSGPTPTQFALNDEKPKGAGAVNPFYIYLLDNAITRTTHPLTTTAAVTKMQIIPTTIDYLLRAGDTFYIYHPTTFNSKKLTCETDLLGVAPFIGTASAAFQRGIDNFPSGSFIVRDERVPITWRTNVSIGSSSTTYLWYLPTVNNWYSSSAYSLSLGTSVGSETDSTALRSCEYIATRDCTIHTITIAFYLISTSDLEFAIYKVPLVNNSTANVTLAQMTHTDNNGSYTANKNYVKTFDITGGNTLTQGQGIAVLARSTDDSTVRVYGRGFMEIELQ